MKSAALLALLASLHAHPTHRTVLAPEGAFVAVFNPRVEPWIREPLTPARIAAIRAALAPHLRIDLTPRGFVQAAVRGDGADATHRDATHYDAVWLRDAVWAYYALREEPARAADARRLLLALWDYMSTPAQLRRFRAVIARPALATDQMAVPHIRFDARSRNLSDVQDHGKPEVWNHRQVDALSLFFIALGEALQEGRATEADLTASRREVIALWPRYLEAIDFTRYEDAGAWEELPRRNTSSIGLATRSLEVWKQSPHAPSADYDALIARGLACVRRQLWLGGESPDYPPTDPHFRRADAALLALIAPSPLAGLTERELRDAVRIVGHLQRPCGVLRYANDSYQGGDFWLKPPATANGPTGDTSSLAAYLARLAALEPDTEAQWFFDSWLALAHLQLATMTKDARVRELDLQDAQVHVKRALGQLTGDGALAADGLPVKPLEPPESINTVTDGAARYALPSPIAPLNWARATLSMALARLQNALRQPR